MARVGKVMIAFHQQGGGVRGCSSGFVRENSIVGSELAERRRTYTRFEYYPLGKPLEAKLLTEFEAAGIKKYYIFCGHHMNYKQIGM